ncbi:MAG TPA: phage tail tape measure protein [Firmicutes bacterium]|nr:phage tail tape measure protein [Bacillota bacterium]
MALNFGMFGLGFHFFVKDDASLAMQRIDKAFRGTAESAEEMYYKTKASLDSMEGRFGALSDARVQAALRNTGMVLMGIGAAGLAGAGMAVKASIDYEDAFAGVRKTVDATEEEYAVLNARIRQMAKEVPIAATSIAEIAEAAGQLGIPKEYITDFTRVMADLGVATNMTATQAATSLARFANIVQMSYENFDRLGSTIVQLGNNLATTESEIVDMALRLAGAGNQVGMTEAQILSLAGALSSVGIEAEAGGSAMSRAMIEMANAVAQGSDELDLFAAVAGMTASEFQQAFRENAAGAVISFIEGMDKISAAGINVFEVLEALGLSEVRVRDALLRAAGAGDLFRQSMELGATAWEENVALAKEAEERYQTTVSQLQIFKNTVNDISLTFGDMFLPTVNKVLRSISDFLDRFHNLPAPVQKAIGILLVAGSALTFLGGTAFVFVAMIPSFVQGLNALQIGMATFNAVVLANPITWLIVGIVGLIAVVVLLVRNWDRVTAAMSAWWSKITGWFTELPGWVKGLLAVFMPVIGIPLLIAENWDTIKAIAGNIFSQTVEIIRTIIFDLPGMIWDVMMGVVEKIRSAGVWIWDAAKSVFGLFTRGAEEGLEKHSPSAVERSMFDIMEASRAAVTQLAADFRELSSMRAVPQIGIATAGAPAAVPAPTAAAETTVSATVPVMIRERRTAEASASMATKPHVIIKQPLKLILDGRVVAETVIEFIEDAKLRQVIPAQ